jgi:hypothetical protein
LTEEMLDWIKAEVTKGTRAWTGGQVTGATASRHGVPMDGVGPIDGLRFVALIGT